MERSDFSQPAFPFKLSNALEWGELRSLDTRRRVKGRSGGHFGSRLLRAGIADRIPSCVV